MSRIPSPQINTVYFLLQVLICGMGQDGTEHGEMGQGRTGCGNENCEVPFLCVNSGSKPVLYPL